MQALLITGLLILLPATALPQSIEIFAATGAVQVWNDESNLGLGMPLGGGIGFRSPHGWGLEALVERQQAKRRFASDVRFDSTVLAGRARLLKYFRNGRTQPYAGAGLGVTRIKSTFDYPADCALTTTNQFQCTSRDVTHRTSSAGTVSGFAGVRVAAGRRVFVRPEFELSRAGEHLRIGALVSIGAAW